jgi:hypothetical protein
MIKIAHEAPLSIFNRVQEVTDYDYALVHLFEENNEYWEKFVRAKEIGREIILDNSIFELGTAFEPDKFALWIERLKPTWYIIPDALEDAKTTVKNVKEWVAPDWGCKSIGVVQGKSYDEIVWCYKEIEPFVDKVAISFDYHFFVNEDLNGALPTKYHHYMYGRDAMIHRLLADKVINENKPHHLLGCGLPQEFDSYRGYSWIDSIDTSNPVVAAIKGMRYDSTKGLQDKPSQKLYTMLDQKLSSYELQLALYNIECFRAICNG